VDKGTSCRIHPTKERGQHHNSFTQSKSGYQFEPFTQIRRNFMRKFIYVLLSTAIAIVVMGCSSTHDDGQTQRAEKAQEELDRNVGK
jgi:hypothetical protein